ncbi:MAG: hypothetical protein M3450_02995 [Actinomycetota bacterium]|nr:hypothetical protein [Actinomycetota bacterium]
MTWGTPSTTTGFTVEAGADPAGGRVVVAPLAVVVVAAGTVVVVVGSTVVEGAVGTGPSDCGSPPPEHAPSTTSRPATAMVEARELRFRRIVFPPRCFLPVDDTIIVRRRNRRDSVR